MPREHAFTCPLPMGIHARPASALEEVARRFRSAISLLNVRSGRVADAKSVLSIVGSDIRFGDRCTATVDGTDEAEALAALARFLDHDLARCDDALPPPAAAPGEFIVPPVLRAARAEVRAGTPASPGIGRGYSVRIGGVTLSASVARHPAASVEAELRLLRATLEAVLQRYDSRLAELGTSVEADVLRAHRSVTRDPAFGRRLDSAIREDGFTVAGAIESAGAYFSTMLANTGSQLLRERALDVRDVCIELLREAYGDAVRAQDVRLDRDAVCMADTLTPGQLLAIDRRHVRGLVLGHAGTTSHTVILARSFGIPTLAGIAGGDVAVPDGTDVIVDADLGVLVTNLTEPVRRYYAMEENRLAARRVRLRQFAEREAATEDGRRVRVAVNISSAEEVAPAVAAGAEGIGLFRTEMLFVDRDQAPSEDEQFEHYRRAVVEADGRPVVIRTLDVGGDKPIPYLGLPREDNPFLGYRAVRMYPRFETLFRGQVRAVARASAFGRLKLMIPMVSALDEVRWVRAVITDEQQRLAGSGVPFDNAMAVGAMIEVPSAAFLLDRLRSELDFFSIGSNDLLQYFVAADRTNAKVSGLYDPLGPAFLRLLRKIVDDLHARDARVSLCGEMAGQVGYLPLLVGLELDELSMPAPNITEVKAELAGLSAIACRALLFDTLDCSTAGEVAAHLEQAARVRPAPLIDPELVVVDADCRSKEEAIKQAVDGLYAVGRTDRPREVEDAVWQREAVYSTGFGHGFAIPHCKTDAVRANSLTVLKLHAPVEWGSLDEKPVRTVLLLAIRESDQATAHMKVLAALARQLMHAEFRERFGQENDPASLCRYLKDVVGT